MSMMDDEAGDPEEQERRLADVLRMLAALRAHHEATVLSAAEASLAVSNSNLPNGCPPPLCWHPYYRTKTWLIDWLNDKDTGLPKHDILIPISRRPSIFTDTDPAVMMPSLDTLRMTKRRAGGPAPWTGRPFHYEWNVGTDNLGRHIAGESRIIYED